MIRSEHSGTGPLSSQLLQKAHQALKNDGKVTAKELHELRQELGPNPTQDELTFIANLDNPDVVAAINLLEKGEPVENVVQAALAKMDRSDTTLSAEAGKSFKIDSYWARLPHIQKTVNAIRGKSPEEVDQLLEIMEKVRQQKPLNSEEQKRLSATVPEPKLIADVQVQLLRSEMTHELQRLHLKNPTLAQATVNELVQTLTATQERPSRAQLQAIFEKVPALARRPALLSGAVISELRPVTWGYQAWSEQQAQAPESPTNASKGGGASSPQAVLVNDRNQFYDQMLKMNDNELRRLNFEDGDIAGLTGLIHNQGSDLAKLFQEQVRLGIVEGRGPGSNTVLIDGNTQQRVVADLDLKSKMGYVLVQAMRNYNKPEMAQLATILDKLGQPGQTLSNQENALLRTLGLRFQDGKLYNLANKEEISSKDLGQLKQVAQLIQRIQNPRASGFTLTQVEGLAQAFEVMARNQLLLTEVKALEEEIKRNDADIQQLRVKYDQTLDDLAVAQKQQQEAAAQAQAEAEKQRMLNSLIQQAKSGQWDASFLQQFGSAEKLADLNKLLAEYGLSLELGSGSPTFKRNGQSVGPELLGDYFQAALQGQAAKLKELDAKLAASGATVTRLQIQADQEAATLNARVIDQTATVSVFKDKLKDLKKENSGLEDLSQNPDLAGLLPIEYIGDLRSENRGVFERLPALLAQAEETLSQATESLMRGHLLAQLSAFLLQQVQDLQSQIADLFAVSDNLNEALKQQLDEELQALIAKANEAQALLSQSPRPDDRSLEQSTQKWLEQVLKTTEQINLLLAEQQNARQTERAQVAQQVEKIRRNAEYHLKQLTGFDTRRSESVDDILRKSIQNFQSDRPFLARSIQKL